MYLIIKTDVFYDLKSIVFTD